MYLHRMTTMVSFIRGVANSYLFTTIIRHTGSGSCAHCSQDGPLLHTWSPRCFAILPLVLGLILRLICCICQINFKTIISKIRSEQSSVPHRGYSMLLSIEALNLFCVAEEHWKNRTICSPANVTLFVQSLLKRKQHEARLYARV